MVAVEFRISDTLLSHFLSQAFRTPMLLPRYSIRTILYLAILVAVMGVVGRQAVGQSTWAIAVVVAVGSLLLSALVYLAFYAIVAAFARVTGPNGGKSSVAAYYPAPFPAEDSHADRRQNTNSTESTFDAKEGT